jgi:hypothetical protein
VFEAKTSRCRSGAAVEELDEALAQREADFAVLVVPSEERPRQDAAACASQRGDSCVVLRPRRGPASAEVAYSLARARVLMARRGEARGASTPSAVRERSRRREAARMGDVLRVQAAA